MSAWPDIGVAARMVNDLKRARRATFGDAARWAPQLELRLHPDDLADLRRRFGNSSLVALNGVPVIADSAAERLPRASA